MSEDRRINGCVAELAVAKTLLDMGYVVSEPLIEARYDFVVEIDDKLHRVQVKNAYKKGDTGSVTADLRTSVRGPDGGPVKTKYGEEEIDAFALYNKEDDEIYWLDVEETGSRAVSISTEDKESFQHRNGRMKFAEDYRVESVLSQSK